MWVCVRVFVVLVAWTWNLICKFIYLFHVSFSLFRTMPRKVNYGVDYDEEVNDYEGYDYDYDYDDDDVEDNGKWCY